MCFGIYFDKFLTAEQQENEAHSVSLEGNHHLAIHAKTREEKERKGENATVIIDNLRRPEEGFGLGRRKRRWGRGFWGASAPKKKRCIKVERENRNCPQLGSSPKCRLAKLLPYVIFLRDRK